LHKVIYDACIDPHQHGPVVDVKTNMTVVDVDQSVVERPVVITKDGQRFEGDVVIGADGIRSAVRKGIEAKDTVAVSREMVYRVLIPVDFIRRAPATRSLVVAYQSTFWFGPARPLVHYMVRRCDFLNIVPLVPADDEIEHQCRRSATAEDMVEQF